jgi:hypothetical protein
MSWAGYDRIDEYQREKNRRDLRRKFRVPDTVPIYASFAILEPVLCGERAGWFTRSGRRIESPQNYKSSKLEYRESTQVIKVPIRYEGLI